jgi:acyl-CoA thioesterase-1
VNPVALQLANGNAFLFGLVMVIAALALCLWNAVRVFGFISRITYIAGIVFVILSATPLPIWCYGLWLVLCIMSGAIVFSDRSSGLYSFRWKFFAAIAVSLFSMVIFFIELPYHLSPTIQVAHNQTVYVIGDSVSAGISTKEHAWPDVLGDMTHLKVINLAKPGATVQMAIDQCEGITESNSLVFVEIGGNDLLGNTSGKTFYNQLDFLLGKLRGGNNQTAMFELPLLPFCNSFGYAQRTLARKYNVILIPKHYLTDVFGLKDGTLDGLHLSQKGHDALAKSIYGLLK